jgi:alkanesulfonate monooxygenase SsuD/methylene tetrahydromethanopterin reductase-like flavin-dependent oxidoreductase (luciferase family)
MPALGAAAAVTRTLELGTCVAQAGVREPAHVAADAATLDLLAPGRVVLGIGAGHTPREWSDIGRRRPAPRERAERLTEFAEAVAALPRGEKADLDGRHLALAGAQLEDLPAGGRVRLTIGGGHPLILAAAARHADVVGLSGLGRTLPDGHYHEVRWTPTDVQRQLQLVRDEAKAAGNSPAIEVLVQSVQVTGDRTAAVEELAARIPGATAEDISRAPFVPAVPDLERVLALINPNG